MSGEQGFVRTGYEAVGLFCKALDKSDKGQVWVLFADGTEQPVWSDQAVKQWRKRLELNSKR